MRMQQGVFFLGMGIFGPANNLQGVWITESAYLWLARYSMTVPHPPFE
jgi:hypothetical protein